MTPLPATSRLSHRVHLNLAVHVALATSDILRPEAEEFLLNQIVADAKQKCFDPLSMIYQQENKHT